MHKVFYATYEELPPSPTESDGDEETEWEGLSSPGSDQAQHENIEELERSLLDELTEEPVEDTIEDKNDILNLLHYLHVVREQFESKPELYMKFLSLALHLLGSPQVMSFVVLFNSCLICLTSRMTQLVHHNQRRSTLPLLQAKVHQYVLFDPLPVHTVTSLVIAPVHF